MTGIKALADRLNISIGTVSRALNDKPGVNPDTRDRVLRMAQETGYVPNAAGRNLRKGLTNTIGLVIGTGPAATKGGDNFFMAVTDAMQRVMLEDGVDLILLPCHGAMDPLDFLRRTLRRGAIDGLILTATQVDDPRIALLAASHLPFMTLGRSATPGDYSWVDLDFEGAARQSVARLAALGHRRIAVGLPASGANLSQLYRDGWQAQMQAEGLHPAPDLILADEVSEDGGAAIAARLLALPDRPTAIIMCSEPTISGFCGALLGAGLRPGADVAVIGFRQSPLLRHLAPPVSCFDMDLDDLGKAMARTILSLVYAPDGPPPPRSLICPMTYVETASVRPPSTPD